MNNRLTEEDKENAAEEWIDKYMRRTGARSNLIAAAWTHCKAREEAKAAYIENYLKH